MDISYLIGKTMASVENRHDEELIFKTTDGREFVFYHSQDCCESVYIESISGDLADLVGAPILLAEEVSCEAQPDRMNEYDESYTWTFYKFATRKGYVDVRWYGTSNGWYSESVDFMEILNNR